jgi:peptidoglycan/LPS O-acetylase OafA/YrhL
MKRLPELDFLRGIAVLLVLFAHLWAGSDELQRIGWIGVDLFFVLSGFLVAGLLFHEQKKHGKVRRFRFLVRRGFKIYPMFYASILLTLAYSAFVGLREFNGNYKSDLVYLGSEIFFLQNYIVFIWPHHWSLAVEEHFYALLALTFPLLTKWMRYVPLLFVVCLVLRIVEIDDPRSFFYTHLRLDSLLMGVYMAYAHSKGKLEPFYRRNRRLMLPCLCLPLIFLFIPSFTYFTQTIGFIILYISFACWLMVYLFGRRKILWSPISTIGFYSYGIYLFHMYLARFVVAGWDYTYPEGARVFTWWTMASFTVYFFGSILLGITMSFLIERPFLALREKLVPRQ